MKYRVHIISELFVLISIVYLIFTEYDEGFNILMIFISSIIFLFEILRISTSSSFQIYRSKNLFSAISHSFKYSLKNISLYYIIFSIFVILNSYDDVENIKLLSLFISLIALLLIICLGISTLVSKFVPINKNTFLMVAFLCINYTFVVLFPDDEVVGLYLSFFSVYFHKNLIYSFLRLTIVFIILVVLFYKSIKVNKYAKK